MQLKSDRKSEQLISRQCPDARPDTMRDVRSIVFSLIVLTVATIACLVPFVGKAFHIDDPLFIWTAEHIQKHPTDPYGFTVNWYGTEMKMWEVMRNPPLTAYYIALVAPFVGWSETGLHIAFLIPAVAVVTGTYYLARAFCGHPIVAAVATLLTPAFLVSSTTIMCDTMMLAFWMWAIALWVYGIRRVSDCRGSRGGGNLIILSLSAISASACVMTKFNGICVLPLMFVYAAYRLRKVGTWFVYLVIPVAVLLTYRWIGLRLYGHGFVSQAMQAAVGGYTITGISVLKRLIVGLSFTGGLLITTFFFAPFLFTKRGLTIGVLLAALMIICLPGLGAFGEFALRRKESETAWSLAVQFGIFVVTGVGVLALSVNDFLERRDEGSLLLGLWIVVTFLFATFVAWSVSGRYLLPLVPAAGLIIVRKIEGLQSRKHGIYHFALPLILTGAVSFLAAIADYSVAGTAREAAAQITRQYGDRSGALWYHGHWGFQYYMSRLETAKPADAVKSILRPNDILVTPENNSKAYLLPAHFLRRLEVKRFRAFPWLSTMDHRVGAGFHSDRWGPLPYTLGRVPPEEYEVAMVTRKLSAPFGASLNLQMGIEMNKSGKTKEAIKYLLTALDYEPSNAQAMFQLGLIADEQGDVEGAIDWYRKAIRCDPLLAEAHLNLGAALRSLGKLDDAIHEYELAIKAKPSFGAAHNNLAVALFIKGDYAGAWREVNLARQCGVEPPSDFIEALQQMTR